MKGNFHIRHHQYFNLQIVNLDELFDSMNFKVSTSSAGLGQLFRPIPAQFKPGQIIVRTIKNEPEPLILVVEARDNANAHTNLSLATKIVLSVANALTVDSINHNTANLAYCAGTPLAGAQTRLEWDFYESDGSTAVSLMSPDDQFSISEIVDHFFAGTIGDGGTAVDNGVASDTMVISQNTGIITLFSDAFDTGTYGTLTHVATFDKVAGGIYFE